MRERTAKSRAAGKARAAGGGGSHGAAPVAMGGSAAAVGGTPLRELFAIALRLGLTSFGGPVAHLAYFRDEYVVRRRWLDEAAYADLVALCQFLPGPASSQVGIAVGFMRAGWWGGLASWLGFTLPSAVALTLFAHLLRGAVLEGAGWLRGLLLVAVAVVAQAVWGMAARLAPDPPRATFALGAAIGTLVFPTAPAQVAVIALAGVMGFLLFPRSPAAGDAPAGAPPVGRRGAVLCWVLFAGLLLVLPFARALYPARWLAVFDSFYRAGSLVFGGGHVVLPLLQAEVVPPGWVTPEAFVAGYGAAQAVPGPLFTFAAYLGAAMGGWPLAAIATVAVFLPSFLLVAGALPLWSAIRARPGFQAALRGINAAVVGILLGAFYDPVWTKAIHGPVDFAFALAAFGLLAYWKVPPWAVVAGSAAAGALLFSG